MRPTIAPGDLLAVSPIPADGLRVGDVVAVLAHDGAVHAHRLIALAGEHAWTRGDAAPFGDPPYRAEHLIGLVRRGGRSGAVIARWPWLAPLLGAVARARGPGDLPGAFAGLLIALAIRLRRAGRRGR